MEDKKVKQVIVIRKDLKMRTGKAIAQGSHASLGALLSMFNKTNYPDDRIKYSITFDKDSVLDKWLNGIFTKICVYVNSEEELIELYNMIRDKSPQIPCVLIEDAGLTEFHNVKTKTCIGVGPWWNDEIDEYTKKLPLL